MKLTATLFNIQQHKPTSSRFNRLLACPNLGEHNEIDLLETLNIGYVTVEDIIWALRATEQDSRSVSIEFARRCTARAATQAAAHYAMMSFFGRDEAHAAYAAADAVARAAANTKQEREHQRQDLIELLTHQNA